jgi:hypothetical protein
LSYYIIGKNVKVEHASFSNFHVEDLVKTVIGFIKVIKCLLTKEILYQNTETNIKEILYQNTDQYQRDTVSKYRPISHKEQSSMALNISLNTVDVQTFILRKV